MTACPKIVEETIPSTHMDLGYGTSTNIGINLFLMISMLSGFIIPANELLTSTNWKIIYLIPIPLLIIAFLL